MRQFILRATCGTGLKAHIRHIRIDVPWQKLSDDVNFPVVYDYNPHQIQSARTWD